MALINIIRVVFIVIVSLNTAIAEEIDLSLFNVNKFNDNVYVASQKYPHSNINFAIVVGENNVALITSMMKEYSRQVQSIVKDITQKKIEYVFALDGDYYQYNGSRLFVESGATFVARENLIPDAFENRILVTSQRVFDLKNEIITATPTKAHTDDHMMLKLTKSNMIFAGDAIGFDWIVYSGNNGPLAHLDALKGILSDVDDETKIFPGNWFAKQYGNKVDLENFILLYEKFVNQVFLLSKQNMKPDDIAADESIHSLLRHLNAYDFQKDYLVHYVKDVLGEK